MVLAAKSDGLLCTSSFQESLCKALDAYEEKEDVAIQEVGEGGGGGVQVVHGGKRS